MKCPFCSATESKVIDKRTTPDGLATRRRRECLHCEKRFTTYERVDEVELFIIKRDGAREVFDRTKLLRGISQSCHKRQITYEQMQDIVNNIESKLRNKDSVEFKSTEIGRYVMQQLKKIDKVAYIRFASIYKDFTDVEDFGEEIQKLIKK